MRIFCTAVKLLVLSLVFVPLVFAQSYKNFPAAVHIQSSISDGKYPIDELAKLAKENSVKILIISDTFLRRWEYGLWPWRNLIKRRVEENSIMRSGPERYLAEIKKTQAKNPEVLLVPALEVAPFYYWRFSLFKSPPFSLYNWHKKLLVAGLNNSEDYKLLPVAGNYSFLPLKARDLIKFWPVVFILLGLFVPHLKRIPKYILIGLGAISLINNLRFPISPFNSYQGERGIKPYQLLVDYVNRKGGAVFWLHPEANYTRTVSGVKVWTTSYKEDLLHTLDYTGFSGMYHDIITITEPGDLWDKILTEYCQGKRERPVWILGEVGFDGISRDEITSIQTIFLLSSITTDEVLRSLKTGRMYTKLNLQKNDLSLERFTVSDVNEDALGIMGDEVSISGIPRIEIRINNHLHPEERIIIKLIRQGKVVQEAEVKGPQILWVFIDPDCPVGEKIFYRLELKSNICEILTNPVFVKGK